MPHSYASGSDHPKQTPESRRQCMTGSTCIDNHTWRQFKSYCWQQRATPYTNNTHRAMISRSDVQFRFRLRSLVQRRKNSCVCRKRRRSSASYPDFSSAFRFRFNSRFRANTALRDFSQMIYRSDTL